MSFQFPIKIYYPDTDAMGLVYHAHYLKFFDQARTEVFHGLGISFEVLKQADSGFVVAHIDTHYKKPAQLEHTYTLLTHLVRCNKASILFEQKLCQGDEIYCTALVKVAYVNLITMKPIVMPDSLRQQLKKVESHCAK